LLKIIQSNEEGIIILLMRIFYTREALIYMK